MSKSSPERAPTTPWSSLEPYSQLLRALLPRMSSLSVFDARGHMHWSSEMTVAPEIAAAVAESVMDPAREPGSSGLQRMAGSEPIYLFWLMSDGRCAGCASVRGGCDRFPSELGWRAALILLRAWAREAGARMPAPRAAGAS